MKLFGAGEMNCIQEAQARQPAAVLIFRNIFTAPVEIFRPTKYFRSVDGCALSEILEFLPEVRPTLLQSAANENVRMIARLLVYDSEFVPSFRHQLA